MKIIAQLEKSNLSLLVDSQDTEELREVYHGYEGFFVRVGDGEYTEVWGFVGTVPYKSKIVSKLK